MTANSRSVRRLKATISDVLNVQEQAEFAQIINSYFTSNSISELASGLGRLLDTRSKRQLIGKLRKLIPRSQVAMYDRLLESSTPRKNDRVTNGLVDGVLDSWSQGGKLRGNSGYVLNRLPVSSSAVPARKTKSLPRITYNDPSSSPGPISSPDLPNWEAGLITPLRRIRVDRSQYDPSHGLGLSIRGGAEHGLGIYVSSVDENSVADRRGLQPGDQIVAVNGISFRHITNNEAVKIISSARQLSFEVCHVGRVPGAYETHQEYIWADRRGRTTSPPPEVDLSSRYEAAEERKSGLMLLKGIDERKVNLSVGGSRSMGIMIRGGKEFGLGIYISGVDRGSAANHAGLKVGDQILDVNGISFLDILHRDAVTILKSSKRLMFTVKDIGKIPYAMTTYDHTEWIRGENLATQGSIRSNKSYSTRSQILDKYGNSENSMFTRGLGSQLMLSTISGQVSQMAAMEHKAEQLLTKKELAKMKHYLSQYQSSVISVDHLLLALYQLFDTKAKLSLMSQIRGLIAPTDLDEFDSMAVEQGMQVSGEMHPVAAQFPLHDSWALHSLSNVTSSSNSLQNSSNAEVADEMEPLRKAIREIYDFDGNKYFYKSAPSDEDSDGYLAPTQKKSPWQPLHQQQNQKDEFRATRTSRTNGNSELTIVAEVHHTERNHRNGKTVRNVEQMDKAVATDDDDDNDSFKGNSFQPWSLQPMKINSIETKPDANGSEGYETLEVLPYYAQVHLRAVRQQTGRGQDGGHLMSNAFYHRENSPQKAQGRTQASDQKSNSGQKFGGKFSNGYKSNRPTLDTVYELHYFSDDNRGTNDLLDDDRNAELSTRGSSGGTPSRYQPSKVSVAQSHHTTLEVGSTTGFPSYSSSQTNRQYAENGKSRKGIFQAEKSGNEVEAPIVYLNDGDGLSDRAEAMSEMTDDTSLSIYSKKSNSKHDFAKTFKIQDQYFFGQENSSKSQRNSQINDVSHAIDLLHHKKDLSNNLKSPPSAASFSQDLSRSEFSSSETAPSGELQLIKVYKTKPTLGIAIQGGANARQPNPKIAKIQASGSAYTSDLQEGQVIVAVDGRSVFGLDNEECAALIAKSFNNKSRAYLELLILDRNQHLIV